ncbi:ATP-dependent sacrificial sulfur transferase LarE [Candidatus Thorarchaeota archaeon]|nr:MAG: ATP-dependent sacrificial sulfur transferase LarE [Candidatus Thorarchaeota archaeon]
MAERDREHRFDEVRDMLRGKRVIVAFSGGVDSTVLAHIAAEVATETLLLTIDMQTVPQFEIDQAVDLAGRLGVEHKVTRFNWTGDNELSANRPDRCYHCKRSLAKLWLEVLREREMDLVVEGTNATDVRGHRPGLEALQEIGVVSPFLSAGIGKEDIRAYARERSLGIAEKPAQACLATRFPPNVEITEERLAMIETVENTVRELYDIECVRARYHGDLVRIELPHDRIAEVGQSSTLDDLVHAAKETGFRFVTLDLEGYRSGSTSS